MKLCICLMKLTFSSKMSIGLPLDKASLYNCEGLAKCVQSNNSILPFIDVGFVTENLTLVYLSPDITITKDLKVSIRRKFDYLLSSERKKIGDEVEIAREEAVSIVTVSFEDANKTNETDQCARHDFNACGLNLHSANTGMLERHLA